MAGMPSEDWATETADRIRSRWPTPVRCGVVLGTGAGTVVDSIDAELVLPFSELPGLPATTATGHRGRLVCGRWRGVPVIAQQGRFHLYEGHSAKDATLPIRLLAHLGVEQLVLTNAAGGLRPHFCAGELMLITSHLDWMFGRGINAPPSLSTGSRPAPPIEPWDPKLIETALAAGRRGGFAVHAGVYAALLGPNYETRAEYRMLRKIGADAAGMSTVPEAVLAAQLGMRVVGVSVITNVANPDQLSPTSGEGVVAAGESAANRLQQLIEATLLSSR